MKLSLRAIQRASVAFGHDLFMAAASYALSLYLRLGDGLWTYYGWDRVAMGGALFIAVAAPVFWYMGLYRGVWRYASLGDLTGIAKAVTATLLIHLPALFLVTRLNDVPRSFLVINWFVLMAMLGGPRILYRLFKDGHARHLLEASPPRGATAALLVGAGDAAELFVREMARRRNAPYVVAGIIDEKGHRVGRQIRGVRVLGDVDAVPAVIARLARRGKRPQRLIVTKDDLDKAVMQRLFEHAEAHGMTLARLPRITELRDAATGADALRPVDIADLLGRPQAVLDRAAMAAMVAGRRVLITGAGGAIGSELTRQVAAFKPARLALFEASEHNLYEINREIADRAPALARAAVLGDVRDRRRVDWAFAHDRPELVFHAAALKHVPLVEANPVQGVLTNVVGTRHVADACVAHGVGAMVQISTDKAVNPASVMGATKRLAECYCQALDIAAAAPAPEGARAGPHFITVRFGNVLGSSGSVVPLFQEQLARGGPLTVTHPDAERYFMTVREAVELVLQASALAMAAEADAAADGAGAGRIFVLDMGEPVRIVDLARQMIRLAGKTPDKDVAVTFIGLRPGERLEESLFHDKERLRDTAHAAIRVAAPRAADAAVLGRAIDELAEIARSGQVDPALALLRRLVPEYRPADVAAHNKGVAGAKASWA